MSSFGKETATLTDRTPGNRCRTNRLIRTHAGNVPPSAVGTILSEIHNLGRHMLEVRWDGGVCAYVFPDEIEIVAANR
ncbi:MAG: hypothetical protein ACREQV_08305 [Candidatus Binatia bacterium]